MNISFSAADVAAWAGFSGDHNPIHFDRAAARRAGFDDLIVHGMLAVMPVKQLVSDRFRGAGEGRASARFKAFFRSPLPYDRQHLVTSRTRRPERHEFVVQCAETQAERMRGSFTSDEIGEVEDGPGATRRHFDGTSLASFAASFPAIQNLWIGLDAMAFAEFVRRDMRDVAARVLDDGACASSNEAFRGVTIMQTSEDLLVSKSVVDTRMSDALAEDLPDLSYGFVPDLILADRSEASGTVRTMVWIDGVLAICAEYGLLMRSNGPTMQLARKGVSHVGR